MILYIYIYKYGSGVKLSLYYILGTCGMCMYVECMHTIYDKPHLHKTIILTHLHAHATYGDVSK